MRYSVNVSILFTEVPFLERFARARDAGFTAVELWWPRGEDLGATRAAIEDAGVDVVLLNFDAGDMPAGDRGLSAIPRAAKRSARTSRSRSSSRRPSAARKLNALAGHELPELEREAQLELARENVRFAADAAGEQGAEVLIEAVNTIENGPYLLSRTAQAADFVRSVGRDNVRLQYDAYHMQRMEGNLVATIERHFDAIAHVQVADSPGRGQPGTGEINFDFVLRPARGARLRRARRAGVQAARRGHGGEPELAAARAARQSRRGLRGAGDAGDDRIHRPGRDGRAHGAQPHRGGPSAGRAQPQPRARRRARRRGRGARVEPA